MSAYDDLSDEMVAALMKGVLETDRAYNYNFDDICTGAKIAMDLLKAENESLRKDAERYRWLRMCDWFDSQLCVLSNPKAVLTGPTGLGADCPSRERLDSAVDAAISSPENH